MYYAFAFFKSFINYFMALSLGGDRNTIVNEFSTLKITYLLKIVKILICGKSQIFISLCPFVLSSIDNIDVTLKSTQAETSIPITTLSTITTTTT